MAVDVETDGRRGIGALLRDLAEGSADLVRGEVRLARIELGTAAGGAGRGVAFFAMGGVLLLLGTLATFTGVILLVGDQWLPRDLYWLAARGRKALSPSALVPAETVATLKEDKEWLKQRLT
jgi:hypothetical protein